MQMTQMTKIIALLAAAVILTCTQISALPQATTVTSNATFPFTDTAVSCGGETVNLSGNMHLLAHVTTDARSGRHVILQINTQSVKGVGATSGNEYVSSATNGESLNDPDTLGGQSEYTTTTKFLLIGKGKLPDLLVRTTIHITINANGEATAEVTNVDTNCR